MPTASKAKAEQPTSNSPEVTTDLKFSLNSFISMDGGGCSGDSNKTSILASAALEKGNFNVMAKRLNEDGNVQYLMHFEHGIDRSQMF